MCGPGAERLYGLRAADAVGRDVRDLLTDSVGGAAVTEALARVATGQVWTGVLTVMSGSGRGPMVESRWEPVTGAGQEVWAVTSLHPLPPFDTDDGRGGWDGPTLLNEASRSIGSTLDLARTGEEIVAVAMPRFCDAAGVYVLERLLADELPWGGVPDGPVEMRRLATGLTDADPAEWATAFPVDEVIVYSPATPYIQCMTTGSPVLFGHLDPPTKDWIRHRPLTEDLVSRLLRPATYLAVPLKARGTALGFVVFSRWRTALAFGRHDVTVAEDLAARAAVCIDNARLYARERRTALALQGSLLPKNLTVPPGLEVAHRYLPIGADQNIVGGDWYDVIPLTAGRVAFIVGDVMGHGILAAAGMGQLRTAARAFASLNLPPADVLTRLNQMAQHLDAAQFATCIYATFDPASGACAIARAGHIPPVIAYADGTTEVPNLPAGLPLGLDSATFQAIELVLPPGSILALCTDGLLESRTRDIDAGIAAFRAVLAQSGGCLQATCDAVIQALRHENGQDDITLLLARVTAGPPGPPG